MMQRWPVRRERPYKEKKTRAHQSIKRMRTRERHRMENMTFMEIDE